MLAVNHNVLHKQFQQWAALFPQALEQKRIKAVLDSFRQQADNKSMAQEERKGTLLKEYNMIKGILFKIGKTGHING